MPSAAAPANRPIAVTSSVRLTIPERGLGSTGESDAAVLRLKRFAMSWRPRFIVKTLSGSWDSQGA